MAMLLAGLSMSHAHQHAFLLGELKSSYQQFPTWMFLHSTAGDSDTLPHMEMEKNSVDQGFKAVGCLMDAVGT